LINHFDSSHHMEYLILLIVLMV